MKETEEKLDVVPEMMKMTRTRTRTRTISKTIYTDREGNPVSDRAHEVSTGPVDVEDVELEPITSVEKI